jgi:protein phosphatase
MEPRGAGNSYTGQKKTKNEDYLLVNDTLGLYILCDGSNLGDGKWAAEMACQQLEAAIIKNEKLITNYKKYPNPFNRLKICEFLESTIQNINYSMFTIILKEMDKVYSSTSLDALLILPDYAILSHIGHGRVAQLRNHTIKILTQEHTRYQEMLTQGWAPDKINPQYKKDITRSIGTQNSVQIDIHPIPLQAGDLFFLMSDGYYQPVDIESSEFKNNLKLPSGTTETKILSTQLSKLAFLKDYPDDLSILAVQIIESEKPTSKEVNTSLDRQLEILKMIPVFFEVQDDIDALNYLHSLVAFRKYKSKEVIIEDGTVSDEIFIILKGTVELLKNSIKFDESTSGDLIGEIGVFLNQPRSCSVIAKTEIEFMVIRRDQLFILFARQPRIAVKIYLGVLHEVVKKLNHATEELTKIRAQTPAPEDKSQKKVA